MEYWDLLDEQRRPLGRTQLRGCAMDKNTYHVVVHIWTLSGDGRVLVTLRSPDKDTYPNCWENTGGSVLAGETSLQGALREVREETGLKACPKKMLPLGTLREDSAFLDIYTVMGYRPAEEIVLQEGETVAAKWVTIAELEQMEADGLMAEPVLRRTRPFWNEFLKRVEGTSRK